MSGLYDSLLDRISVAALRRLITILLVAFTVLGCLAFDWGWVVRDVVGVSGLDQPRFGGHEVAEWHLLPGCPICC